MYYLPREDGQGLAEYGLILVLIAMLVVIILTLMGTKVSGMFSDVNSSLP